MPEPVADRNCITRWLPAVEASGVPFPRTSWLRTDLPLMEMYLEDEITDANAAVDERIEALATDLRALAEPFGYPCFLRTGQGSAKHEWRNTCYVAEPKVMANHLLNLVEWSLLHDLPCDVWVIRELLGTEPAFFAFDGMPITRERRYFARDGEILGWHPYWPPDAISFGQSTPDWPQRLEELNASSIDEQAKLGALTRRVSERIEGAWSIDWLYARNGHPVGQWYCTDMARAEDSFCWNDYPTAPVFRQVVIPADPVNEPS